MAWDGTKVDRTPANQVDGRLNAKDWNDLIAYIKTLRADVDDLDVIDGGDSNG